MPVNALWIKRLEGVIDDHRKQLKPFEDGTMRLGHRSLPGPWEDVTDKKIATLKRIIAELEALIAKETASNA